MTDRPDSPHRAPAEGPVLVTGAAGFIGRRIVAALSDQGCSVHAGFHRQPPADLPRGATPVACPIQAGPELAQAMAGAVAVVHTAYGRPETTAAETEALLEAMTAAGIDRLVHLSSIAVYGDRDGAVPESVPVGTHKGARYGRAKIAADWAVSAWALARPDRVAVLLRPGIVYGAGSALWVDGILRRMAAGGWGVFEGRGEGLAPLVHVDDVAEAARRAIGRRLPVGVHPVNLVAPDGPTWNRYTAALALAAGLPGAPRISAATWRRHAALALPAKLAGKAGLGLLRAAAAAPRPGEAALLDRRADYATDTAARLLGLKAWTGLDEGLWRTFGSPNDTPG